MGIKKYLKRLFKRPITKPAKEATDRSVADRSLVGTSKSIAETYQSSLEIYPSIEVDPPVLVAESPTVKDYDQSTIRSDPTTFLSSISSQPVSSSTFVVTRSKSRESSLLPWPSFEEVTDGFSKSDTRVTQDTSAPPSSKESTPVDSEERGRSRIRLPFTPPRPRHSSSVYSTNTPDSRRSPRDIHYERKTATASPFTSALTKAWQADPEESEKGNGKDKGKSSSPSSRHISISDFPHPPSPSKRSSDDIVPIPSPSIPPMPMQQAPLPTPTAQPSAQPHPAKPAHAIPPPALPAQLPLPASPVSAPSPLFTEAAPVDGLKKVRGRMIRTTMGDFELRWPVVIKRKPVRGKALDLKAVSEADLVRSVSKRRGSAQVDLGPGAVGEL